MEAQSKAFRSKYGVLIKSLLGEAQFDLELAEAFRERWIMPRRRLAREVIGEAIRHRGYSSTACSASLMRFNRCG